MNIYLSKLVIIFFYFSNKYMDKFEKVFPSDRNFKVNIKPLNNSLNNLKKINGIYFDWDIEKYPSFSSERQIGLIAQEVKEVYPEIVKGKENERLSLVYDKIS